MAEVTVRHYRANDRNTVRQISWDTAFMGDPASVFFENREFMMDLLTGYFTDYEPGSCFVAESGSTVVGYLLGCCDSRALDSVSLRSVAPRLLARLASSDVLVRKKNLIFGMHMLWSLISGQLSCPDFSREYPATLHINIADGFRRCGAGSRLMDAFLSYLKDKGIPGVRLATYSQDAGAFFAKSGFTLVFSKKRSYFRYILGRDVSVYIYARKLDDSSKESS